MADDLEDRKEETWGMGEVRSSGAESEAADDSDIADDSDDTPTADNKPISDNSGGSEDSDTLDTSDNEDSSDNSGSPDNAEGETVRQMALDAEAKELAVRDLHNVNVYLYEDIYREMVTTFKTLDSEYFQQHEEDLSKNKDFFNAVFRAGLKSPQLHKELELD